MRIIIPHLLLAICLISPTLEAKFEFLEGSAELLSSGDVELYSGFTNASIMLGDGMILDLRLDLAHQRVDYRPTERFDPFGSETRLEDTRAGTALSFQHTRNRQQYTLSASGYEGFRSYSSLWIDEYYRQQYSSGGIPGVTYEEPNPWGLAMDVAYRYEVLPTSGFLTLSLAYLNDRVAPGYEIGDLGTSFELIRGETRLHTWTGAVDYEGILNRYARTRHTIRITTTTTREPRISWNGAVNIAIGENWISRSAASYATENPRFEAWSLSQTFEYTFPRDWALSLTARYYEDTGQIESANLVSSAAPALDSQQVFLSLRKSDVSGNSSFSFSIGPYQTRYAPTGIGTERFNNLYSDRNWWWGRLAFRHTL